MTVEFKLFIMTFIFFGVCSGLIIFSLSAIHYALCRIAKALEAIDERIADVTTEDFRHLHRIRVDPEGP